MSNPEIARANLDREFIAQAREIVDRGYALAAEAALSDSPWGKRWADCYKELARFTSKQSERISALTEAAEASEPVAEDVASELFKQIEHGDAEHRAWLHHELQSFFAHHYTHPRPEAAERMAKLDGNDIWEALFSIMKGNVPDELTEVVLQELAEAFGHKGLHAKRAKKTK